MKVLLTGASGYLGSSIYFSLKNRFDIVGTYGTRPLFQELRQLNLEKPKDIARLFAEIKPDIVIHAGGKSGRQESDENTETAKTVNVEATALLAELSKRRDAHFIFISSAVSRKIGTTYAMTKYGAEERVREIGGRYLILRPAPIFGISPSTESARPMNRILRQLKAGKSFKIDATWRFQPTWLTHLKEIIDIAIREKIEDAEITVTVPEVKTYYEIARDIAAPLGIEVSPLLDAPGKEPPIIDDQSDLHRHNLPVHHYDEMLQEITRDLKRILI